MKTNENSNIDNSLVVEDLITETNEITDIKLDDLTAMEALIARTSLDDKFDSLDEKTLRRKNKVAKGLRISKTTLIYVLLTLWVITTIYPFVWVLSNSFKPKQDILSDSFSFPIFTATIDNYINAFSKYDIFRAYFNSLVISSLVVVIVLIVSCLASFVLVRYKFKGKRIVYGIIIACMMFPVFSIVFPVTQLLGNLNLMNNHWGVILPQVAGNLAFTTILLSGFMSDLPLEVEESAYLDGANVLQVLFRLVIPMSKSAIVTAAIFVFLWSYNDLFLQMIILRDRDMWPITQLLREISSVEGGTDYGLMAASVSLIAVPVIVVYYFLQENIIKGLTAGAVKG